MQTELKVTALMTTPRYEATFARNYIEIALRKAGVPLVVSGGVFYGQCMQQMLGEAIKGGADVAITIDFDSMFTAQDVHRLLQVLVENDGIDAVAALQCRRGKRFPLLTTGGDTNINVDGSPFRVVTAHFGLTAIDLHKLKTTAKPWFFSQPDPDGDWGEAKIDDDIWFWQQWREAGHTVFIDPETRIGHLEEMVAYYDDGFQPKHDYPMDWAFRNYPAPNKEALCQRPSELCC